jgi:hypothetical protein
MKQWYLRFKAGNWENGYYEIGENFDLVKEVCKAEFIKDWKAYIKKVVGAYAYRRVDNTMDDTI